MKVKYMNVVLLFSFLLAFSIAVWHYFQIYRGVEDISFNSKMGDDPKFELCNNKRIYQHYSYNTFYDGERRAIKKALFGSLKEYSFKDKEAALVTFRFVVNCHGQTDRFRVKSIDKTLKAYNFNLSDLKKLLEGIKKLDEWLPATDEHGLKVNSYMLINFKFCDGKVIDIY